MRDVLSRLEAAVERFVMPCVGFGADRPTASAVAFAVYMAAVLLFGQIASEMPTAVTVAVVALGLPAMIATLEAIDTYPKQTVGVFGGLTALSVVLSLLLMTPGAEAEALQQNPALSVTVALAVGSVFGFVGAAVLGTVYTVIDWFQTDIPEVAP